MDAPQESDEQEQQVSVNSHFVDTERRKEVEIRGATFHLREMNGEEQDAMKSAAHQFDSDGNFVEFDVGAKHNNLLKHCVVDAPDYNEVAENRYGKPFNQLGMVDKLDLLNSLRGHVREALLDECLKMNGLSDDEKN